MSWPESVTTSTDHRPDTAPSPRVTLEHEHLSAARGDSSGRAVLPERGLLGAGRWAGVTSAVTLLEVLIAPYRAGDAALAARYEALLTRSRSLHLVDLDRPLLRSAAQLRATTHIRTPDALQLAAALRARCTAYLTNDRRLPSLPGLRVLQLGDYAPAR